jgi:hypothetical protein
VLFLILIADPGVSHFEEIVQLIEDSLTFLSRCLNRECYRDTIAFSTPFNPRSNSDLAHDFRLLQRLDLSGGSSNGGNRPELRSGPMPIGAQEVPRNLFVVRLGSMR